MRTPLVFKIQMYILDEELPATSKKTRIYFHFLGVVCKILEQSGVTEKTLYVELKGS